MKTLVAVLVIIISSLAFADHYKGSYQASNGMSINIQSSNGQLQGSLTATGVQFTLQGQGNQQGAFGTLSSQQAVLGFQAQLSPDGTTLTMAIYQMNQQGQVDQSSVQQLVAQRANSGFPQAPKQPTQPGFPQPPAGNGFPQPPTSTGNGFPPSTGQTGFPPAPNASNFPVTQPSMPEAGFPNANPVAFPQVPTSTRSNMPNQPFPASNPLATEVASPFPPAPVNQVDWAGSYSDGQLTVTIQNAGNAYQGSIQVSGSSYPFQANAIDSFLDLQVQTPNGMILVYMERYEGQIYLYTETDEYQLQQLSPSPGGFGLNIDNPIGN